MSKQPPKRTSDGPSKQTFSEQEENDRRTKDAGIILRKWAAIREGQSGIIDDLNHNGHTSKHFELEDDICADIEIKLKTILGANKATQLREEKLENRKSSRDPSEESRASHNVTSGPTSSNSIPKHIPSPSPLRIAMFRPAVAKWPDDVIPVPHPELANIPVQEFFSKQPEKISHPSTTKVPDDDTLVYEAQYFDNATKNSMSFYKIKDEQDDTLIFESRFESGNLHRAYRTGKSEYTLLLQKDVNTRGHTQWFYFRVTNTRAGVPIRFKIINLKKPSSLYNSGMKPLLYSTTRRSESKPGWLRSGREVAYFKNIDGSDNYTVTFTIDFPYDHDTCYLAYCFPYTYTDLQKFIKELVCSEQKASFCRHRVLCTTYAGNNLDLLTVTSRVDHPEELEGRKGIFVSARAHPGETNSSWMMKGFLEFITGTSNDALWLRDNFIFKIIPMLNPDGVIVGNHRCNLFGRDLNRYWSRPHQVETPEIYHVTNMLSTFKQKRDLCMFLDLHGHSRKNGIFLYGCHNDSNEQRRLRERVLPYMLSMNASHLFSFQKCQFRIQKRKEGTGRITVWRKYNLVDSFTIEASFNGALTDPMGGFHFNTDDLREMGRKLGETLYEYFQDVEKQELIYTQLRAALSDPNSSLQPDETDSEDTTSDEEQLRIPIKKRPKCFIRRPRLIKKPIAIKKEPITSSSEPSSADVSDVSVSESSSPVLRPRVLHNKPIIQHHSSHKRSVSLPTSSPLRKEPVRAPSPSMHRVTIQMESEFDNNYDDLIASLLPTTETVSLEPQPELHAVQTVSDNAVRLRQYTARIPTPPQAVHTQTPRTMKTKFSPLVQRKIQADLRPIPSHMRRRTISTVDQHLKTVLRTEVTSLVKSYSRHYDELHSDYLKMTQGDPQARNYETTTELIEKLIHQ